jgi:hypothetical protein
MKNRTINVKSGDIAIVAREEQDYISITDMVKNFDGPRTFLGRTIAFCCGWRARTRNLYEMESMMSKGNADVSSAQIKDSKRDVGAPRNRAMND